MTQRYVSRTTTRFLRSGFRFSYDQQLRYSSIASVQKRDNFWIPTVTLKKDEGYADATQLLVRAGYVRQAYAGIYHMLPLGLRVQEKLEKLIDKHMNSIGASKVSLSSLSSQALWQKSGRLATGSELFKFIDRKEAKWLLSPTHEEEITTLVADVVYSSSQLPIRLYQISRKYRDEKRPRGGLLRGREFIMKDLYTFDSTQKEAHVTYDNVRNAYRNFLDELKIRYIEARADSGNMGGSLSHEYHFPNQAGEDDVIHCTKCDYARNEEWVPECSISVEQISLDDYNKQEIKPEAASRLASMEAVDKTRNGLVKAFAIRGASNDRDVSINSYAVKKAVDGIVDLDTGVEMAGKAFTGLLSKSDTAQQKKVYYLFDPAVDMQTAHAQISQDVHWLRENNITSHLVTIESGSPQTFSLWKQITGDPCPQCQTGTLNVDKAIEVGHTFHLGTRYSSKLGLTFKHTDKTTESIPVEMGCHGIGVSRLIAAIASSLLDGTGLNWPRVIAPFEAVIVVDGNDGSKSEVAAQVYNALTKGQGQEIGGSTSVDVLLDDRTNVNNGYKLKDADLIGYPVILVIGKTWQKSQQVEIQCRRLAIKEIVGLNEVGNRVRELLALL